MKGLKIVGFVVAGIGLLLVLALVLALTPAVQTWAVRKAVAGQPGLTLEIERVDAGFSAANLTNVHLVKDGMVVTAKGVNAKYNAWDYLRDKRVNVDSVVVDDLLVDLRNAKPAAPGKPAAGDAAAGGPVAAPNGKSAAPASPPRSAKTASAPEKSTPFEGLLKEAQLPMDVRVAQLLAKGRALLTNAQTVVFEVKANTIQTGQKGKLEWTVDFSDTTRDAALRALRSTGSASLHIASDRRIDLVEINADAAAVGPKLPNDRVQLIASAEQPAAGGDEAYSAQISLLRGNAVEPLVKSNAQFLRATHEITGAWEIAVRTEQLAAVLAGLGLPPVAANGTGKFSFKPDRNAASASGELRAQASQLQKLSPDLAAIGAVQINTSFDGALADDVAHVDKLNIDVTAADGRKFAQISSLQKVAYSLKDKKVSLANPQAEVARISLQQLPLAWAQPMAKPMVIESGDVSVVLAVEAEPDGSRVKVRAIEPFAARTVTIRDANRKALVEKVSLTTRPTIDYSATRVSAQLTELNVSLPAGDAVTGTLSAEVTNLATKPATAFTAQLQAKIVAALKPYVPIDTGPLAAKIAVEGKHEGQTLNIAKASATVNRDGGALLATVDVQQPVRVDLAKSTFAVAKPNDTAARVRLGEIPLAWAEAFVADSKFAGTFAGTTLDVVMRSVDDVTLTMVEPAVLRGVSATMQGKPMAQAIDLSTQLTATKRGETVVYDVKRLEVKQGEASLLTLTTSGEAKLAAKPGAKPTMTSKGNLEADVAAIMKQPALADFATLSRGKLTVAFDANMTNTTKIQAVIAAKNLVAKQDNRALGDLDVKLNADVKDDGSGTITLPVTLSGPSRKSDLAIDGVFGKAQNKDTFLFTGKIASNQLFVDDFQPLAGLAPGGASPAAGTPAASGGARNASTPGQPIVIRAPSSSRPASSSATASATTTRDALPFWKAANGKVTVDLKRIVYGTDYIISNVRGTAVVTDTKLSLDGLEGKFKENPFKLAGGLTFAASQPKPYSLTASADVTNFNVGEFLRAANPGEKPALETTATLSARVNGLGGNIGEVGRNAYGKFEISGTKGTMYLLARKGGAGAAVNVLSLGLGILGAARGSDTASALSQVTQMLNAVAFDSVKMQIERAADLSFKLTSLEVLSPELRTTGTGTVASKKIEDVANAPMNITLQLAAKGNLGYLLSRLGMLGSNKDDKGYQLMSRTFAIGGTPSNPDNNALWSVLGQAALGALGR